MPSSTKVSFYPHVEYSDSPSYQLTKDLTSQLWYNAREIDDIRVRAEYHVEQVITTSRSNRSYHNKQAAHEAICQRGLENLIRERITMAPVRKQEYLQYVHGLQKLQSKLQQKGLLDEEQIRKYSCKESKRARSLAELLAARDAQSCSRIYKQDDDWKMLLAQDGDVLRSSLKSQRRGLKRSRFNGAKRNLFARAKLHRSEGVIRQATRQLLIRPGMVQ